MSMTPLSSSGSVPIAAIGSLYIGSGTDIATELTIGTSGKFLSSNGTTPTWATLPTTTLSGDATGSGTTSISVTLANSGVTASTYKSVTVDAKGRVTAGTNPTTLSGYGITDAQPLDGDLTSIAALAGTSGFLKKTATNTWALDTSTYITISNVLTYGSTTSTASLALDLSNPQSLYLISALAVNLTITTSNRSAGKVYALRIKDNGVNRTLTFPSWTWLRPLPAATIAGKWILVTIECFGTNDTDIIADWSTEDSNTYTTYGKSLVTSADAAAARTTLGLATIASSGSAADLSTGTLPDARLSSNVAMRNASNTFTGVQLLSDGSVSAPSVAFSSETGTGWYRGAANQPSLAIAGVEAFRVVSTGTIAFNTAASAPTAGAFIGSIGYGAFDGTAWDSSVFRVRILAAENWTSSAHGTDCQLRVRKTGSTSADWTGLTLLGATGDVYLPQQVGIGSSTLSTGLETGVLLQVRASSSGRAWAANGNLDVLTESSGQAGFHIISGNSSQGRLWFSDTDAELRGALIYDHSADALTFTTAGAEVSRLTSAGAALFGTTSAIGSERARFAGGSAATAGATDVTVGAGIVDIGASLRYRGTQVVSSRKTGWTAATGTATRTTFDTSTVTLSVLAEHVKALIDDLHSTAGHGLIGT